MNKLGLAVVAALVAAMAVSVSLWRVSKIKADNLSRQVAQLDVAVKAAERQARKHKARADLIEKLDIEQTAARLEADREIDTLRAAVRAGERRLSVRAVCPDRVPGTTPTAGVDHADDRADIDSGTAEALVALAARGDDAIRRLTACQEYVRAVR